MSRAPELGGEEFTHDVELTPGWVVVPDSTWPPELALSAADRWAHIRNSEALMTVDPDPWRKPGAVGGPLVGAMCAQTDPELFYPEKGGTSKPAKTICRYCPQPVKTACGRIAVQNGETNGIWAGVNRQPRSSDPKQAA